MENLSLFKCKNCGAELDARKAVNGVVECGYCHTPWTVPKLETAPEALKYLHDGNAALDVCKFEDAYTYFQKAAEFDKTEPEAYFGMALASFKVQYLKDEVYNRLQPICHEVTEQKFTESMDYRRAFRYATREQQAEYEKKGEEIDYILGEFFKLKQAGINYDCFICTKVTDEETKQPTEDSKDADYIYRLLQDKGYKPFYSERELRNVTGADYEARILYALFESECMLVVCRKEEYLKTPWVKNEYTRFIKLVNDEGKESDSVAIVFHSTPIEKLPGRNGKLQGINFALREAEGKIVDFVEVHTPEAKRRREEEEERKKAEEEERKHADEERQRILEEQQKQIEEKLKELERKQAQNSGNGANLSDDELLEKFERAQRRKRQEEQRKREEEQRRREEEQRRREEERRQRIVREEVAVSVLDTAPEQAQGEKNEEKKASKKRGKVFWLKVAAWTVALVVFAGAFVYYNFLDKSSSVEELYVPAGTEHRFSVMAYTEGTLAFKITGEGHEEEDVIEPYSGDGTESSPYILREIYGNYVLSDLAAQQTVWYSYSSEDTIEVTLRRVSKWEDASTVRFGLSIYGYNPSGELTLSRSVDMVSSETFEMAAGVARGYRPGSLLYDFTLDVIGNDETYTLSEHRGKIVVINFWYTTCGPCVAELPSFQQVKQKYGDEVEVIAIHQAGWTEQEVVDWIGKKEDVLDTSRTWASWDVTFLMDRGNKSVSEIYTLLGGRSNSYPMTLIIDENGFVKLWRQASMEQSILENTIDEIISSRQNG